MRYLAAKHPDLVGRDDEMALLFDLIGRTMMGFGGAVVFTGDVGMGKSALLAWAAALAADSGVCVLQASGVEFENLVSFSVLHQLLSPVLDELDALPGRCRTALSVAFGFEEGPAPAAAQLADAVVALTKHAAGSGPVLLVADDLHWVDRATSAVLTALVPALKERGLSLLGASRPGSSPLGEAGGTTTVALGPLNAPAASALFTKAHPDVAPTARDRLLNEAEGNPLALLELPRLLSARQRQALEPLPAWLPLPRRLEQIYATRINALPAPAQRLLLLIALGPTVSLSVLAPAFPATPLGDVVQALVDADMVRTGSDRLLIRHPIIRAAVVAGATPEQRTGAHQVLGQVLSGMGEDLERRAWHLFEAESAPSAQAASLLEQAATLAYRRGNGAAAMAMLLRSADMSADPAERMRRLARAAYVGASVNVPQAARIIEDLHLAHPGTSQSLGAAVAAAIVFIDGEGDVDMAHRLLTRAISGYTNRTDPTDETLLEAISVLRWVCWLAGRPGLWEDYRGALDRLDPAPPPLMDLASRTSIDPARTTAETVEQVDELLLGLAAEINPARITEIADIAYMYDRIPACRPALERVAASAENGGLARAGAWAHLQIGLDAFHRGQWATTESAAGAARRLIESSGQEVLAWACDYEIALIAATRGDGERATELVDTMARWAIPRRAHTVAAYGSHVEALAAAGRGDFERVFQHASVISPAGELAPYAWLALNVQLDLVESALRTGRTDAARAHVQAMADNEISRLSPRLAMVCLAASALVAAPAAAPELFERALAMPEGPDWPFDYARIQLLYGSVLRRNQAVAASRLPLRQSLATFERLGAKPWAERARKELGATAEKREATVRGFHSRKLTPQELEIAALAAGGLPNKKIAERFAISHRTVGNHLYQVYAKLGIASRAGLRDALQSVTER